MGLHENLLRGIYAYGVCQLELQLGKGVGQVPAGVTAMLWSACVSIS
jgi:hypothetical protein